MTSSARRRTAARTSPTLRRAAGELADVLATGATLGGITVELAVAAISWDSPDTGLDQLRNVARFADRPVLAWQAHHALGRATASVVRRLSRERVHAVAVSLTADDAPANALLALALAAHAGPGAGWPEPWRALLRGLCRHPDPDVAQAALDTLTSPE